MENAWADLFIRIDNDDIAAVKSVVAIRPDAVVHARNDARFIKLSNYDFWFIFFRWAKPCSYRQFVNNARSSRST